MLTESKFVTYFKTVVNPSLPTLHRNQSTHASMVKERENFQMKVFSLPFSSLWPSEPVLSLCIVKRVLLSSALPLLVKIWP